MSCFQKRRSKYLLLFGLFFIGFFLSGCSSLGFQGSGDLKSLGTVSPPLPSRGDGNYISLGRSTTIKENQSRDGWIGASPDGWGDAHWFNLVGVSVGTPITVTLSATGNFDVGVWRDGSWPVYDTNRYTVPKTLRTTAGSNTWIWVNSWKSSGAYRVTLSASSDGGTTGQSVCKTIISTINQLGTASASSMQDLTSKLGSAINSAGSSTWECVARDTAIGITILGAFGKVASKAAPPLMKGYVKSIFKALHSLEVLLPSLYKLHSSSCPTVYTNRFAVEFGYTWTQAYWLAIVLCTEGGTTPPYDYPS